MKISITTTNFQKDFVLPSDEYFVGITLIYENMSLDIIKIKKSSLVLASISDGMK